MGPQDVALAIIGKTFADGTVKNRIMEFFGPGIKNLGIDFRNGIDVMTTETSCLSSIWETDEVVRDFLVKHGRAEDYKALSPVSPAYYDIVLHVDLSKIEPMIAMPFHPSNTYTIRELKENPEDILRSVDESASAARYIRRFPFIQGARRRNIRRSGLYRRMLRRVVSEYPASRRDYRQYTDWQRRVLAFRLPRKPADDDGP